MSTESTIIQFLALYSRSLIIPFSDHVRHSTKYSEQLRRPSAWSTLASPSQENTRGSDAGTKFAWSRLWFLIISSRITARLFWFRFMWRMLWTGIGTSVQRWELDNNIDSSMWLDCCIYGRSVTQQIWHRRPRKVQSDTPKINLSDFQRRISL